MSFGTDTDYFGLGDTHWKIQSSGLAPAGSPAQTQDSNGDNACETIYDEYEVYTASYRLIGIAADTQALDDKVKIGQVFAFDTTARAGVDNIDISTSNTENPLVTVQAQQFFGDTAGQTTFASAITLAPVKQAQGIGFTEDTNSRVTSSGATITGQVYRVLDSDGDPVQSDIYQGRVEATGELVSCTVNPGAAADTGYTLQQAVSRSSENTRTETGTINLFKNLTRA